MRRSLQYAFEDVETILAPAEARTANTLCLNEARRFCRWLTSVYLPLSVSGFVINIFGMTQSREERALNIKSASVVTRSDWLYWPVWCASFTVFSTFGFISGGYDMLFLSLCMHISSKCQLLQVLIRHASQPERTVDEGGWLQFWRDDGSAFGRAPSASSAAHVERALRTCALYHQQIIKLRDTMEQVFAPVSLVLMGYLLMGLGVPAIRMLYEVRHLNTQGCT
ncbi:hypothetical protein ONE63_009583 [Megalurothrips usitatus]|uniref:Uncharacterized protein n=1 Tax=Megalurothrips usitatus TaxID=439358 RepID=A0AAV7XK37_9NEOP|nr:hypothetical protein ONE63_009583 [Megalurothrips usitatus]